jgi:hypothetical protein
MRLLSRLEVEPSFGASWVTYFFHIINDHADGELRDNLIQVANAEVTWKRL